MLQSDSCVVIPGDARAHYTEGVVLFVRVSQGDSSRRNSPTPLTCCFNLFKVMRLLKARATQLLCMFKLLSATFKSEMIFLVITI